MVGIIDYGVGNLFSIKSSFESIGEKVFISDKEEELENASHIILPGVGAFGNAAEKLRNSGLDKFLYSQAKQGKPIMGICLGMQLLFEESYEYGKHQGLGLIKGQVVPMKDCLPVDLKIPHMGWNRLQFVKKSKLFTYISDGDYVYFVHSFYATECGDALSSTAEYGVPITATVEQDNIYGCQFHPEKSGRVGLSILKAFCEI